MKQLIAGSLLLVVFLAGPVFGQSARLIDSTYINPSDSTSPQSYYTDSLSAPIDMAFKRLRAIQFDSTLVADTIFIQTTSIESATGVPADTSFTDAYYTKSDGTQVTMHIPVQANKRVGINPLWADLLSRYIRFRTDAAETSTNRQIKAFGQ